MPSLKKFSLFESELRTSNFDTFPYSKIVKIKIGQEKILLFKLPRKISRK